eukprot:scaffold1206_cov388-Prasinococcus_capsulatus_cf.AAC.35
MQLMQCQACAIARCSLLQRRHSAGCIGQAEFLVYECARQPLGPHLHCKGRCHWGAASCSPHERTWCGTTSSCPTAPSANQ